MGLTCLKYPRERRAWSKEVAPVLQLEETNALVGFRIEDPEG